MAGSTFNLSGGFRGVDVGIGSTLSGVSGIRCTAAGSAAVLSGVMSLGSPPPVTA